MRQGRIDPAYTRWNGSGPQDLRTQLDPNPEPDAAVTRAAQLTVCDRDPVNAARLLNVLGIGQAVKQVRRIGRADALIALGAHWVTRNGRSYLAYTCVRCGVTHQITSRVWSGNRVCRACTLAESS